MAKQKLISVKEFADLKGTFRQIVLSRINDGTLKAETERISKCRVRYMLDPRQKFSLRKRGRKQIKKGKTKK